VPPQTSSPVLDILFYIFAVITVVPAFLMVASRSPVNSAMYMIATFVGMACLFVLLDAFFIAVLQILVYAGAVMVLFLFIIMLLDMDQREDLRHRTIPSMAAMIAFGLLLVIVLGFFKGKFEGEHLVEVQESASIAQVTDAQTWESGSSLPHSTKAKTFGYGLFSKYMLPFQVTGILLLVAMVGVIVISKPHKAKGEEAEPEEVL
jgi:NADH-quinone oxidoreductase subunit J